MKKSLRILALLLCTGVSLTVIADEKPKQEKPVQKAEVKFTAKCPVSGADADKEQFTAYKNKKTYFCCEKCKAAFEADNTKYAVKANHQLVQTRQFRQTKCPFSGGDMNKEQAVKMKGVNVQFCCEKCKGKAEAATGDDQLAMVFSDDAFKKGFEARQGKGKGKKKTE
ncbi:MAG: hypothetical protein KDA91_21300 [Planctomycetaceae bacterium]|nr:hypothetical protein [Planctomycetaceae bacterium]